MIFEILHAVPGRAATKGRTAGAIRRWISGRCHGRKADSRGAADHKLDRAAEDCQGTFGGCATGRREQRTTTGSGTVEAGRNTWHGCSCATWFLVLATKTALPQ